MIRARRRLLRAVGARSNRKQLIYSVLAALKAAVAVLPQKEERVVLVGVWGKSSLDAVSEG